MPKVIPAQEKPCFTPGPWQQDGSRIYGPGIQRKLILQVHYSGRGYQEEDTANEKILLATPDLYEALKLMIEGEVVESHHAVHPSKRFCKCCGRNSEEYVHSTNCPVLIAELAIAKAEGRHA